MVKSLTQSNTTTKSALWNVIGVYAANSQTGCCLGSGIPGDFIETDFNGTALGVVLTYGPVCGKVDIWIDNQEITQIDTYNDDFELDVISLVKTDLSDGPHVAHIQVSGVSSSQSQGIFVYVHGIVVSQRDNALPTVVVGNNNTPLTVLINGANLIGTLPDVVAAAVATPISSLSVNCRAVCVRSLKANAASIRVGDSNVSASRGDEISPGDAISLGVNNLNSVYIFGNGTDKVSITYIF